MRSSSRLGRKVSVPFQKACSVIDSSCTVKFPLHASEENAIRHFLWLSSITAVQPRAPAPSPVPVPRKLFGWYRCWNHLWLVSAASALGGASAETVPELAGDFGQGAHATGTGGLSALGLLGPVVCTSCVLASLLLAPRCPWVLQPIDAVLSVRSWMCFRGWIVFSRTLAGLGGGVATRGAGVLLDVHGSATCVSRVQSVHCP